MSMRFIEKALFVGNATGHLHDNFYLPNTFESVAKMVPAYAISAGAVIGNGARNYSVRDAALSTVILQDSLR